MERNRKIRLSPMQGAILFTLEEAGAENLPTVVNTLRRQFIEISPREYMEDFEISLQPLLHARYVLIEPDTHIQAVASQDDYDTGKRGLHSLLECLIYDDTKGIWQWDEMRYGSNRPLLVLTSIGEQVLRR